jgi:hypothetical protein
MTGTTAAAMTNATVATAAVATAVTIAVAVIAIHSNGMVSSVRDNSALRAPNKLVAITVRRARNASGMTIARRARTTARPAPNASGMTIVHRAHHVRKSLKQVLSPAMKCPWKRVHRARSEVNALNAVIATAVGTRAAARTAAPAMSVVHKANAARKGNAVLLRKVVSKPLKHRLSCP